MLLAELLRLDRDLLEATLPRHASGVQVLSQSHRVEDSAAVSPAQLGALLHFLRRHYGAVVVAAAMMATPKAMSAV